MPSSKRRKLVLSVPEELSLEGTEFFALTSEGETVALSRGIAALNIYLM